MTYRRCGRSPRKTSLMRIILPPMLSIVLFISAIYLIVLPALKTNIMERKREMIRHLTEAAWSSFSICESEEKAGRLTREEAQVRATELIRNIRYGPDMKDYFWINDMHPSMIMHPYRPDLDGKDLTDLSDPNGKRLFVAFVNAVRDTGAGYVDYMWQWKDDPDRVVPKLSYVKEFEPWGWIIGTGIYLEDVQIEIASITRKLTLVSFAILAIIAILSIYIVWRSLQVDSERKKAEKRLRESEERLKTILNSVPMGVAVIDLEQHVIIDINPVGAQMVGAPKEQMVGRVCHRYICPAEVGQCPVTDLGESLGKSESVLLTAKGDALPILKTAIPVTLDGREHIIDCFMDISDQKRIQKALRRSEKKYRNLFNNAQVGLFRTKIKDGKVLEGNDRIARMFGYDSSKEFVAEYVTSEHYADPGTRERMLAVLKATGEINDFEARLTRKDGSVFWVRYTARIYPEDGYMEGVATDITEEKRAERRLEVHVKELSLAREASRAALKNTEAERDKSEKALAEVSEAKRRLEVLLSDSVAREKRMVELKQEVNDLLTTLQEKPKYEAPQRVAEILSGSTHLQA
ncbi:MAG: cache domain-containing protein [Proteobacteria bacterium]|nr:cache domain-containing protein [Pseudomonadota bacterium]